MQQLHGRQEQAMVAIEQNFTKNGYRQNSGVVDKSVMNENRLVTHARLFQQSR